MAIRSRGHGNFSLLSNLDFLKQLEYSVCPIFRLLKNTPKGFLLAMHFSQLGKGLFNLLQFYLLLLAEYR